MQKGDQELIDSLRRVVLHPVARVGEADDADRGDPALQPAREPPVEVRIALAPDVQRRQADDRVPAAQLVGVAHQRPVVVQRGGKRPGLREGLLVLLDVRVGEGAAAHGLRAEGSLQGREVVGGQQALG